MKISKVCATIWIMILTLGYVSAQADTERFGDTGADQLTIQRLNGQTIKVIWAANHNLNKHIKWEQLLEDFQQDFGKVVQDIPAYDYSTVNYVQGKSLVVDEVTGRETYTVNEEGDFDYIKSNACRIVGDDVTITIAYDTYQELLDAGLSAEIAAATTKVNHRFYLSSISNERYIYDATSQSLIRPKNKLEVFVPLGFAGGVLRNKAYFEASLGLGATINDRMYVAASLDAVNAYNSERRQTEADLYCSLRFGETGSGMSWDLGFNIDNGVTAFDNLVFRTGLRYKTKEGITLGAQYYLSGDQAEGEAGIDYGFCVGFSF